MCKCERCEETRAKPHWRGTSHITTTVDPATAAHDVGQCRSERSRHVSTRPSHGQACRPAWSLPTGSGLLNPTTVVSTHRLTESESASTTVCSYRLEIRHERELWTRLGAVRFHPSRIWALRDGEGIAPVSGGHQLWGCPLRHAGVGIHRKSEM
jgi:hypothetical protein